MNARVSKCAKEHVMLVSEFMNGCTNIRVHVCTRPCTNGGQSERVSVFLLMCAVKQKMSVIIIKESP